MYQLDAGVIKHMSDLHVGSLHVVRPHISMASVDSGVETGNDSNDSSIVQHESQHATTVVSPVATAANISAAIIGQDAVGEVASVAITDTCKSNETFLPNPSYLMTFGSAKRTFCSVNEHWPADRRLYSVSDPCKLHDLDEAPLAAHDTHDDEKWHRSNLDDIHVIKNTSSNSKPKEVKSHCHCFRYG